MATFEDIRPAILEVEVYDGVVVGQALEITATLLDLQNTVLTFVESVREEGAQAFGMLFFRDGSTELAQTRRARASAGGGACRGAQGFRDPLP